MSGAIRLKGAAWRAEPLPSGAKAEHLRQAETRHDEMRRYGRAYRRLGFAFGAFGMALGAVGVAAALLFPRTVVEARFFTIDRATGEVGPAIAPADAPRSFDDGTARQYLRAFVEACDGYLWQTAALSAHRCALLLTPEQQARHAAWFTARNPEGPQAVFGRTGSVRPENLRFVRLGDGRGGTQVWQVRYVRVETRDGNAVRRPWMTTVQFQWRPHLPMAPDDRTLNNAGFQALDYASQPDPAS